MLKHYAVVRWTGTHDGKTRELVHVEGTIVSPAAAENLARHWMENRPNPREFEGAKVEYLGPSPF